MSDLGGAPPPLPTSAWVLAWVSLGGQVVTLLVEGVTDDPTVFTVVSMALGGLVVGWVAAGVLRARTVRLVLAWVVMLLVALLEVLAVFFSVDPGEALLALTALTFSAVSLAALARFCRSDYVDWQRRREPGTGPPIGRLVAIGVAVGVLGGLVGPVDQGAEVEISVSR